MIIADIKKAKAKNQNYNTQFTLYPVFAKTPNFITQPLETFSQYTWLSSTNTESFIRITPSTTKVSMVEGTEFSVSPLVFDESNAINVVDDRNVTYIWRRDGAPIYGLNSQNKLKGTKSFYISGSQCRKSISGTYQLEAINRYGSKLSEPFDVEVINKKTHPELHKNLILNPSGVKGLEGWTADTDFKVEEFSLTERTHASIPQEIYKPYQNRYVKKFQFSLYSNESRLSSWFAKTMSGSLPGSEFDSSSATPHPYASYNRWFISNYHPNLVDTDNPGWGNWSSFFPAWEYLDKANKNENLYTLDNIVNRPKTYFTRDKIKFTAFGGAPKSIAYQDIDVSNVSSMIDGETYGVDKLVAHFFAYIGVGISKYNIKYLDYLDYKQDDNMIPLTYPIYVSGGYAPEDTKQILFPYYQWATDAENCFCCPEKGLEGPFVYTKDNEPINITPVADDITDVKLEFYDEADNLLDTYTVKGPDERDIWSVKEKFFVPYYLGNLYVWMLDAEDEEIKIFNQRYTTMDAIRAVDIPTATKKDINAEWMQAYHYPLYDRNSNEYRRINKSDLGAAAMFGISADIVLPRKTRRIRVNIIFNHKSTTIFDSNPKVKQWDDQEIYYDYLTNTKTSERLFEYGNPRCGITAMHLSLHPDSVDISPDYNTYKIPLNNVWYKRRNQLSQADAFWSVVDKATPVNTLTYTDIKPDGFYVFGNTTLAGPTSVYTATQQQAALGYSQSYNPSIPPQGYPEIPTVDSVMGINDVNTQLPIYRELGIQTAAESWTHKQWQVDLADEAAGLDGTYYNIYDATGSTFRVNYTPTNFANKYRLAVSMDDIRYYYSQPYQPV